MFILFQPHPPFPPFPELLSPQSMNVDQYIHSHSLGALQPARHSRFAVVSLLGCRTCLQK